MLMSVINMNEKSLSWNELQSCSVGSRALKMILQAKVSRYRYSLCVTYVFHLDSQYPHLQSHRKQNLVPPSCITKLPLFLLVVIGICICLIPTQPGKGNSESPYPSATKITAAPLQLNCCRPYSLYCEMNGFLRLLVPFPWDISNSLELEVIGRSRLTASHWTHFPLCSCVHSSFIFCSGRSCRWDELQWEDSGQWRNSRRGFSECWRLDV